MRVRAADNLMVRVAGAKYGELQLRRSLSSSGASNDPADRPVDQV